MPVEYRQLQASSDMNAAHLTLRRQGFVGDTEKM